MKVARHADGVTDAVAFQEAIEFGQGERGIGADPDAAARKAAQQTQEQSPQDRDAAVGRSNLTGPQMGGQQTAGVALEDQQGMINRLAVGAVVEAELLLPVRGIRRGIQVEHDLAACAHLLGTELDEPLQQQAVPAHPVAAGEGVFPAAERGLGGQRLAHRAVRDELEGGVVTQTVGVVGVFVAGHDLIEPLPQQARQRVIHLLRAPRVGQGPH